jgi:hypothetical protein
VVISIQKASSSKDPHNVLPGNIAAGHNEKGRLLIDSRMNPFNNPPLYLSALIGVQTMPQNCAGAFSANFKMLDIGKQREKSPLWRKAGSAPIFAVFDSPRGREWVQALMMIHSARLPGPTANVMEGEAGTEVTSRYYEALRRALPHLSADELWWRFERTHGLLTANQGRRTVNAPQEASRGKAGRDERAWLITFLAGALQAPATNRAKDRE